MATSRDSKTARVSRTRSAVDASGDVQSMDVTMEKVIGTVKQGEGYKLVAPDGTERHLGFVDSGMLLVGGWDEAGVFNFTSPDGFAYRVEVGRDDISNPVSQYESMSDGELVQLQKDLNRMMRDRERGDSRNDAA